MRVPVVDVFAGCGGLSEGFARISNGRRFDIALALDSDPFAHQTHLLRSFYHQFPPKKVPGDYFRVLRGDIAWDELFKRHPAQAAAAEARIHCRELGASEFPDECLHQMIDQAVAGHEDWVLIGGPPCQAYSVAGRSRNKGNAKYDAASDKRHFLYREYLKILHKHRPAVFVMENVPGILNSKVNGRHVWQRVLEDLIDPSAAVGTDGDSSESDRRRHGYHLHSLVTPTRGLDIFGVPMLEKEEYIVRCEDYGVPQVRQRVLLLGVRADIVESPKTLHRHNERPTAGDVLTGLPRIRSGLSRTNDTAANWESVVRSALYAEWWNGFDDELDVRGEVERAIRKLKRPRADRGGNFVRHKRSVPKCQSDWYVDERIGGVCNHESKAHMETDIHRYLFAACHAKVSERLLRLSHFPEGLLPEHENVRTAPRQSLSHSNFADRFAVQLADEPARTVVSHISKDGHYYIHPDPTQCRSLTVREAARLQTFPDNYFFVGNRTEQYRQVGNAVPPLLSLQIAEVVSDLLDRASG